MTKAVKGTPEILEMDFRSRYFTVEPLEVCIGEDCMPAKSHPWFDELRVHQPYSDVYNGGYFDEIYYARAAEEMSRGRFPFENTHPPLGKIFIYFSTLLGGLNPFFWRLPGALAGVALPFVMFWFARILGLSRFVAFAVLLISLLDFSRTVMSRLATLDMMATTIIFCCYAYLTAFVRYRLARHQSEWSYQKMSGRQVTYLLGLGGLLGLAIVMKWTAVFCIGFSGLALLLLMMFEVLTSHERPRAFSYLRDLAIGVVVLTVPIVLIYYAGFAWEYSFSDRPFDVAEFIRRQQYMFGYHSNLTAGHPYGSKMLTWPFLQRPLWLATETYGEAYYTLSVFGHPMVWWGIVLSIGYGIYTGLVIRHLGFLIALGIFTMQWLPWVAANRVMFIYHYLPSLVAGWVVLGIVLEDVVFRFKYPKRWVYGATSAAVGMWLFFWPVFMGAPTFRWYARDYLRWFKTWVF